MEKRERIDQVCSQCGKTFETYIGFNGLPHRMFCTHLCSQRNRQPKMIKAWKAKKGYRPTKIPEGVLCACGCGEQLVSKTVWDDKKKRPRMFNFRHAASKQKVCLSCLNCGSEFKVTPWESRRRKFCTSSCGRQYYSRISKENKVEKAPQPKIEEPKKLGRPIEERMKIPCPICGKIFEITKAAYESERKITCSAACGWKINGERRIAIGDAVSPRTHRRHLSSIRPQLACDLCGFNSIPEILHLHHKDGNSKNGEIPNLEWLCPNCHMGSHYKNRTGPYSPKKGPGRKQFYSNQSLSPD